MQTHEQQHWVVVGAGSAGCVVAARLVEDPDVRVTLIEAGPDLAPDAVPAAIAGPSFLEALAAPGRAYDTLAATRTTGAVPRNYARGRGIGGSSSVNAMVGLRGDPALPASWGWDDVDEVWARVRIPTEFARDDELGPVDRALLASLPHAELAPLTRRAGARVTSAEAYLWPQLGESRLAVRADSPVDRVVVEAGCAVGVELVGGEQIPADRVVVTGGAIHTPWLLQRSGLASGFPAGQGVGDGLQDHPSAPLTLVLRDGVDQDNGGLALASLAQQRVGGDVVQVLPMNHLGSDAATAGLGLLMVALMTPRSAAGTVRHDPDRADPVVAFELLSDPADLPPLIAGVRLARDVLRSSAFDEIVEAVYVDAFGTGVDALRDDESIESWLRGNCGDYVHAASSCRIGTVLDDDGWLRSVTGLAVCDASAFPSIPDVNTHLPTTMLAERLVGRWGRDDALWRRSS